MRLPIVSTLIVAAAVALMIALGLWQLDRREGKEALLAHFAANADLPPIAFPGEAAGDAQLFRRAAATCRAPGGWRREGGRAADGTSGYRHIATCRSEAGATFLLEAGVSRDPEFRPQWNGGAVTGTVTYAPDPTPLLSRMLGGGTDERTMMLVADTPVAGLSASRRPDPSGIPNNHLAYAVQWFLFAGIAAIIYLIALARRRPRA